MEEAQKMNQWILKNFKKKTSIKLRVYFPDKRAKVYYSIPDQMGNVSVRGMSWIVHEDFAYMEDRPTFIVTPRSTEPLDPRKAPINSLHNAKTFNTAMESKIAYEFLNATRGNPNLLVILMVALLFVVGGFLVYQYQTNQDLMKQITLLNETLSKLMGG